MIYLQLFWEFFQTGLFAVGGGLATLPFLQSIAERYPWFTAAELTDMIAVAESTPGPIGINMATYAGMKAAGIPGALIATLSVVLPSLMIIILIAALLNRFRENAYVQSVLSVLRPASVGLIAAAIYTVVKTALFPAKNSVIFSPILFAVFVALAVLRWKAPKLHPIVLIALGAVCGIVFQL